MKHNTEKPIKVLVIFEYIPEKTYKTIVDMSVEEYSMFKKANGYIVNSFASDKEKDLVVNIINYAFSNDPECLNSGEPDIIKKYFGTLKNLETLQDIESVDKFIWCGFYI